MLKVLCFYIVLSFYTLQVKSQVFSNAVPDAPKAPSVPISLGSPKGTSAPKISAALNPDQPTVAANVNCNVGAAADAQGKAFADLKVPTAPKEPDTPKEPSTPKVSASLKLSQPTVDANVNLKQEACASTPEYTWEEYNGTIPSNAMPASDDPNNPVYVGLAEPKRYNCTFAIFPSQNQKNFRCNSEQVKENDRKTILTVKDKKKFKWQAVNRKTFSNIDVKDLVETYYQDDEDTYWYVGRMKGPDGTFEVGDIIYKMFFSSKKNNYIPEGYEALVHSKTTNCS